MSQEVSQTAVAKRVANIAYGHFLHFLIPQEVLVRALLKAHVVHISGDAHLPLVDLHADIYDTSC